MSSMLTAWHSTVGNLLLNPTGALQGAIGSALGAGAESIDDSACSGHFSD